MPLDRGAAAAEAVRRKHAHYAPRPGGSPVHLVAWSFETYGHIAPEANLELSRLARIRASMLDAARSGQEVAVQRRVLHRWREELSVILQKGNAAMLKASADLKGAIAAVDTADDLSLLL